MEQVNKVCGKPAKVGLCIHIVIFEMWAQRRELPGSFSKECFLEESFSDSPRNRRKRVVSCDRRELHVNRAESERHELI